MDENTNNKKYNSQKIPGQHTLFDDADTSGTSVTSVTPGSAGISFDEQGFAEIEIDTGVAGAVPNSIPDPQRIPTVTDPIRIRFNEMRQIARDDLISPFSNQSQFYHKHVQRSNSAIFYQQAMFMKDFEDDFDGNAPYSAYFANYQLMGYDQLRTYFTWRTKMRRGEIEGTSLSYAFIYIYELINNIGVESPEDGLDQLMTFWKAFRQFDDKIDKYMLKWLKDYHIYYDLPTTFQEFIAEHQLQMHYPGMLQYQSNSEDNFELFCNISKYNIKQSAFYQSYEEEQSDLIPSCFRYVIECMKNSFQAANLDFDELIYYTNPKSTVWVPFSGALFFSWYYPADKMVVLSDKEIYFCRQNKWSYSTSIVMDSGKQVVGYIMKQMESTLRQLTNFKYKLSADISMIKGTVVPMLKAYGISLETAIDEAVLEYYKEINKVVVTIDESSLSQIRKEANDTQEKLIVPEAEDNVKVPAVVAGIKKEPSMDANINQVKTQSREMDTRFQPELVVSATEDLVALQSILTEIERNALAVILAGGNIKQFADEQQIMLEVLADSINEKAFDSIGDNILELDDSVMIYEEYQEMVMEMVKQNGK